MSLSFNYLPKLGNPKSKTFVVYVFSVNNVFGLKQVFGYNYPRNFPITAQGKTELLPPSRFFVFAGVFFSFGIDRSEDIINNNL